MTGMLSAKPNVAQHWQDGAPESDPHRLLEVPRTDERAPPYPVDPELLAVAQRIYGERRRRDAVMARHALYFREPGWDMLLDLFISHSLGRQISVSSACLSALIPQTTALRYLGQLEIAGLIYRKPDPRDGRRHHLVMSTTGILTMQDYLKGLR